MEWKFNGSSPVYLQIMEQIRGAVLTGEYPPGQRIPSVRELAAAARVNPNTMQRALTELEREELLVGGGTLGRYVTSDRSVLDELRRSALHRTLREFLERCKALGVSPQEAAALLLEMQEKEEL